MKKIKEVINESCESDFMATNIALFIKLRLDEKNRTKSTDELRHMVQLAIPKTSRPAIHEPQHPTKCD